MTVIDGLVESPARPAWNIVIGYGNQEKKEPKWELPHSNMVLTI